MTTLTPPAAIAFAKTLIPGLLVTALVAMAAAFLGSHYKGSMLLFALLLGLALHFISEDKRCAAGIQFASSTVLRLGVALLGLRLTIDHVVALGWQTVVALMVAVTLTIALGLLLARLFKVESSLGVLIGGATAICGASAALAISSVLPKTPHLERDTTLTVVGVTTLSTAAMVVYPLITQWLGFDAVMAGQFIGATIHDVAQVVGAGYSLSPQAGDAATITKLMRVAFLMPVLVVISLVVRKRLADAGSAVKTPLLPWFTVAFVVLMLVNSTGWVPSAVQSGASNVSQAFLVLAIAGVGLKTSLKDVTQLGWRPVAMIFLVTLGLAFLTGGYLMATH
ncbi:YeiH family protein [Rhodoferax sp. PAMC 29310]|uniref:YeiH family protein n=1 Tax=Rhodoferax sp. PAMC 29310 TaxID=2822760 RepID=UPI001B325382|nr:putative sulfate exporter family transporter [Rhodoferax sp. PAMC 29310]